MKDRGHSWYASIWRVLFPFMSWHGLKAGFGIGWFFSLYFTRVSEEVGMARCRFPHGHLLYRDVLADSRRASCYLGQASHATVSPLSSSSVSSTGEDAAEALIIRSFSCPQSQWRRHGRLRLANTGRGSFALGVLHFIDQSRFRNYIAPHPYSNLYLTAVRESWEFGSLNLCNPCRYQCCGGGGVGCYR
jgi:hypothetical protein